MCGSEHSWSLAICTDPSHHFVIIGSEPLTLEEEEEMQQKWATGPNARARTHTYTYTYTLRVAHTTAYADDNAAREGCRHAGQTKP